jgi:DNA-binding protein Fis
MLDGASRDVFDDMVRQTLTRYLQGMNGDELLDVLAFIIRASRAKSAMRE